MLHLFHDEEQAGNRCAIPSRSGPQKGFIAEKRTGGLDHRRPPAPLSFPVHRQEQHPEDCRHQVHRILCPDPGRSDSPRTDRTREQTEAQRDCQRLQRRDGAGLLQSHEIHRRTSPQGLRLPILRQTLHIQRKAEHGPSRDRRSPE